MTTILCKLKDYWASALGLADAGGLVYYGGHNNGIIIQRGASGFAQSFEDCFYWASYLAKTRSKEQRLGDLKGFNASQVPDPSAWEKASDFNAESPDIALNALIEPQVVLL
jgi:hypothetical protein